MIFKRKTHGNTLLLLLLIYIKNKYNDYLRQTYHNTVKEYDHDKILYKRFLFYIQQKNDKLKKSKRKRAEKR